MTITATERLARCVVERNRVWDDAALRWAEAAFLDTIGCMVAGASDPVSIRSGRGEDADLITKGRAGILWAPLVNGAAAHALDYDDVALPALNHPSAALVPAILACSEKSDASGAACLDAYLIGYEVMAVLGAAYNPEHYNRGWHTTLSIGACGVAAAISRLLKLSLPDTRNALALSTSLAGGTKSQFGSMAKPLHAGLAAKNGIFAAILASGGLSAAEEAFDGAAGYGTLTCGAESDRLECALDAEDFGRAICRYGLWFKAYPCCASTHGPIGAVLQLVHECKMSAGRIDRVKIRMAASAAANLPFKLPSSPYEARFCLPYCIAVALTDGPPKLRHFTSQSIARVDLIELAGRVELVADPGIALTSERGYMRHPTVALLCLRGQREIETTFWEPLGHPVNPMTDAELLAKFHDCTANANIPVERSVACADKLSTLRKSATAVGLIRDLVATPPPAAVTL